MPRAATAAAGIAAVAALGTHYRQDVRALAGASRARASTALSVIAARVAAATADAGTQPAVAEKAESTNDDEAALEIEVDIAPGDDATVTVIDLDEPDP